MRLPQNFSARDLSIFLFIGLLLVMSMFVAGEWNRWLLSVVHISVFLILYLVVRTQGMHTFGEILRMPAVRAYGMFLVFQLLLFVFSELTYAAYSRWMLLLVYGAVLLIGVAITKVRHATKILVGIILGVATLAASLTLIMAIREQTLRADGPLGNANVLGGYLALVLPLFLVSISETTGWLRRVCQIGGVITTLGLISSFSYTAWVSVVVVALVIIPFSTKRLVTRRRALSAVIGGLAVLLLIIGVRYAATKDFSNAVAVHRTISTTSVTTSFSQRVSFNQIALRMFADHPLTGVGLGGFQQAFPRYATTLLEQPKYVHNYYLELLAETGIMGVVSFVIVLYFIGRSGLLYLRRLQRDAGPYVLGMSALVCIGLVHAGLDFAFSFPSVGILFWLIVGTLLGSLRQPAESTDPVSTNATRGIMAGVTIVLVVLFIRGILLAGAAMYTDRAILAQNDGEIEEHVRANELSYLLDPNPQMLLDAGWVLIGQGGVESASRAEQLGRRALRVAPDNYFIYHLIGRARYDQGDLDGAEESFTTALRLDPWLHPNFHLDLASVYLQKGDRDRARYQLASVLDQYGPGVPYSANPSVLNHLARVAHLLGTVEKDAGDTDAARAYYARALEYDPTYSPAAASLDTLEASE